MKAYQIMKLIKIYLILNNTKYFSFNLINNNNKKINKIATLT